jgi:LPXTG-motif cell wall-anchored protein
MRRGTIVALAALVLMVLSPTAAVAAGSDLGVTVSNPNPGVGKAFTATVDTEACSSAELMVDAPEGSVTIDGDKTNQLTKDATDGSASFTVKINRSGTWTVSARCGNDEQNSDADDPYYEGPGGPAVVTVGKAPPPPGRPPAAQPPGVEQPVSQPAQPADKGILPSTGAEWLTTMLAIAGLLALLAGATVLIVRRRKTA